MLHSLLVVGATAIVWRVRGSKPKTAQKTRDASVGGDEPRLQAWVRALLTRKLVAPANQIARFAWTLMQSGERDRMPALPAGGPQPVTARGRPDPIRARIAPTTHHAADPIRGQTA